MSVGTEASAPTCGSASNVDNEIELISEGNGLAVIGQPKAVETFLRAEGLWDVSKMFDLRRLRSLLGIGSDIAQASSEIAANSARWLKLTPESARLVSEHGLTEERRHRCQLGHGGHARQGEELGSRPSKAGGVASPPTRRRFPA